MSKIEIKNVYKIFGSNPETVLPIVKQGASKEEVLEKTGHTVGLDNVSINIEEGETFVCMGLSGSGKSTLIRHLNRLIDPTDGDIIVDGTNVMELNEKQLIELVGFDKQEGSSSFESCGMRVTLTGKLTRTLDHKKWEEIKHTIPTDLHPVDYKPSLILPAIRYLENNEPETFKQISQAITTKPAKVAVILKDIEY